MRKELDILENSRKVVPKDSFSEKYLEKMADSAAEKLHNANNSPKE